MSRFNEKSENLNSDLDDVLEVVDGVESDLDVVVRCGGSLVCSQSRCSIVWPSMIFKKRPPFNNITQK